MAPFETITIDATVAACDGDGGALGHPKVYLNLAPSGTAECPYCSRRFVNRPLPTPPRGEGRVAGRGRAGGGSRVAGRRRQRGSGKGGVNEISAAVVDKPPAVPGPAKPAEPLPRGAPRHVFLVDGSGFIFRAYHALPPLTRPTARRGPFAGLLQHAVEAAAGDRRRPHRRGLRRRRQHLPQPHLRPVQGASPEPPDDLVPQFKLVREATDAFNVCRIERADFEADDLIATYARQAAEAGATVTIVSSDKDLMQLVATASDARPDQQTGRSAPPRCARNSASARTRSSTSRRCAATASTTCRACRGSASRPRPSSSTPMAISKPAGACAEIKQPKRRQSLIDFAEQARLSKRLVTLDDDVPLPCPLSALAVKPSTARSSSRSSTRWSCGRWSRSAQRRSATPAAAGGGGERRSPSCRGPPSPRRSSYELVDTLAGLDRWIAAAHEAGIVAVEPEGRRPAGVAAELVGIALALEPGAGRLYPPGHRAAEGRSRTAPRQIPRAERWRG